MLLIASCTTTKYIYVYPELDFPSKLTFNSKYDEQTETVIISLEDYQKIYIYTLNVEACQTVYEKCKIMYDTANQTLTE